MKDRKKWKRLLALSLLMALTLLTISGCQNGVAGSGGKNAGSGGTDGNTAKGRYIEEDMELPLEDGESILNMTSSKDGNPVLFVQTDDLQVKRYEYDGTQWDRSSLDWFNGLAKDEEIYLMEVQEAGDGTQLVEWMYEDAITHMTRGGEGKEAEELEIPYLTRETEYGYTIVTGIEVDSAGNYWFQESYESKAVVVDRDTLEIIEEMDIMQNFNMSQRLIFHGADTSCEYRGKCLYRF